MKPQKPLALRIVRVAALLCLSMLSIYLLPPSVARRSSAAIENSPIHKGEQTGTTLVTKRRGQVVDRQDDRALAIAERLQVSRPSYDAIKQTPAVSASSFYGIEKSDAESIETLERTVLTATTPGARIDAVEALTQTNDLDKAIRVLSQVLVIDKNVDVRLAALEALDEIDEVPFEILADVATHDSDSMLRLAALDLIRDGQERSRRVVDFLRRLSRIDSNSDVRRMAATLLKTMFGGNKRA